MQDGWKPLFPLNLVAFPGERLNLHIFEPRYKQLIDDCLKKDRRFGIPSYVKNRIEFGTEVMITEIVKVYDDGRMDIKTKGEKVFKVLNYENPIDGKLYAAGELEYIDTSTETNESYQQKIIDLINELYELMKLKIRLDRETEIVSYNFAHKIGLSLDQEYQLLQILEESLRQVFIIDHLQKSIPTIKEMEKTKEIIKMNGHFNNFDPIDF